ncbi:hypothetical protein [Algibacter pectinivorans]|uniref:Uncharacterized protein n=1 Tax=Algibacter pectinivorans TaxID=870482 RepID=A0A1I1RAQ8_9FLAO|nr:hypothetical protein [Algibacter pectinivorans]SFD28643.1 hypothetical protein SAMN04487987_108104 [Algibacter pectinivorans]
MRILRIQILAYIYTKPINYQIVMIRLNLKPSVIKNINFNKKDEMLEIEFKRHISTAQCINIPLSILKDYVETLRNDQENENEFQPNLTVVHSNFKAS